MKLYIALEGRAKKFEFDERLRGSRVNQKVRRPSVEEGRRQKVIKMRGS